MLDKSKEAIEISDHTRPPALHLLSIQGRKGLGGGPLSSIVSLVRIILTPGRSLFRTHGR